MKITMFEPAHPSTFIKEEIEVNGASFAKAAKALEITRSQLHEIVSGQSAITVSFALKFEEVFGFKAEILIKIQMAYDSAITRKNSRKRLSTYLQNI